MLRGAASDDWALNEEAIANLGYMQMKKTRDAALAIIERVYGARPRFNYYIGSSQGGREALTVAQRQAPAPSPGELGLVLRRVADGAPVPVVLAPVSRILRPGTARVGARSALRDATMAQETGVLDKHRAWEQVTLATV